MSTYPLQRKYYLYVHDALRKLLGADAKIAAFATTRKPFQCDMLVNSRCTDPLTCNVRDFAISLQECMGECDLAVKRRRVDIRFRDGEVLQLALGAPGVRIEDLNLEPDWRRRDRLRISLGFDEEFFLAVCDPKIVLAARSMEKWVYDTHRERPEMWPPIVYWLAQCYDLCQNYPNQNHVTVLGTVSQNFAKYYGEIPFDNPFCPGEDLNTIEAVELLCKAWKGVDVGTVTVVEAVLSSIASTSDEAPRGGA